VWRWRKKYDSLPLNTLINRYIYRCAKINYLNIINHLKAGVLFPRLDLPETNAHFQAKSIILLALQSPEKGVS
jgi:hypothetical protein